MMQRVFGITGWKNSGKTTLAEKLVAELCRRGWTVSTVKHAHHDFDIDKQGTDSFRHRQAGANEVAIVSGRRWALMHELRGAAEPALSELTKRMSPCDLLLVEGFKREPIPKLEVYRAQVGEPLIHPHDHNIVAVASDVRLETKLPQFDLNATVEIADFVLRHVGLAA